MSDTYNMEELGKPFALKLEFGVLKAGMKQNEAGSNELWKPPIAKLRPIVGFNVRVKNEAYWARVRRYANLLKKHGYMDHKPMAGYMGKDPKTGENVLFYTAGYTRMDAIALANRELPADKQITHVTMVVHPRGTTETQLNALLITENEAAPYNAYEAAIVCKRMLDDGNSVEEIAAQVSYTTVWVEALLKLATAPIELQRMVVDDVIKPTFAIDMIETHGDQALTVLQEALARKTGGSEVKNSAAPAVPARVATPAGLSSETANGVGAQADSVQPTDMEGEAEAPAETGDVETDADNAPAPKKVRLTAKDMIKPEVRKFNNAVKKEAPVMYATLSALATHKAFKSFPTEMREEVLALVTKLKELETGAEEPQADPRQVALFDGSAAASAPASASTTDPS